MKVLKLSKNFDVNSANVVDCAAAAKICGMTSTTISSKKVKNT